jgi:molecular chaperone IbpA
MFDQSFSPFTKNSVGFDEIFPRLTSMVENLSKIPTYPPYNIKKIDENKYVIEMAVAGFARQDIEITIDDGILTIKGQINNAEEDKSNYIFKGIADRVFTRKFTLADTVVVKNADMLNGMLKIWLERFVPENKKPKKVEINGK